MLVLIMKWRVRRNKKTDVRMRRDTRGTEKEGEGLCTNTMMKRDQTFFTVQSLCGLYRLIQIVHSVIYCKVDLHAHSLTDAHSRRSRLCRSLGSGRG